MIVLGPRIIENGVDPSTAVIGFGDGMAMLGPASGPSEVVDPIANLFVVLGKMLHCRKVVEPGRDVLDRQITQFGAVQTVVLGYEQGEEFDIVWQPLIDAVQRHAIDPLRRAAEDLDQRTRRFLADETHAVLAIDPAASLEERMRSLDTYLRINGYTVEADSDGFRNFIAGSFVGPDGNRIKLPTSETPTFPDSWICPEQVEPGPTQRHWSIIW